MGVISPPARSSKEALSNVVCVAQRCLSTTVSSQDTTLALSTVLSFLNAFGETKRAKVVKELKPVLERINDSVCNTHKPASQDISSLEKLLKGLET